jgi:hypothetical protein
MSSSRQGKNAAYVEVRVDVFFVADATHLID